MRGLLMMALSALALAACSKSDSGDAHAQTAAATAQAGAAAVSAADKTAILTANHLHANALGLVRNECGDMVTPQFIPADVGLGVTVLFVMVGGPDGGYTCYGDGPDLHLMRKDGAAWSEIYDSRGGYMVILPAMHNGAHDLAFGGPGMSHARYQWNGHVYDQHGEVADEQISNAPSLPNE
ncbi:MAG: hypothetical protein QM759_16370 [Terricaulis sp.]